MTSSPAKVTRRAFSGSLAAAGTFLITGTKASGNIIGANDRLRIAVVGVNGRGQSHIGGWLGQENVEIAYLVDPDQKVLANSLKGLAEKSGGRFKTEGAADLRKVLEDKNLDAISIATPNHWHSMMTIWGAQAGKHVYVEKPMSHDVYEGRVAVEAQKKYGVVVQHGTQNRSDAKRAGLHEAIQAGKFGRLKISYGYCCKERNGIGENKFGEPPANLDWNLWKGPAVIDRYHSNFVHYNWHWFWPTVMGISITKELTSLISHAGPSTPIRRILCERWRSAGVFNGRTEARHPTPCSVLPSIQTANSCSLMFAM